MRNVKGVTLIALVITIIVMAILAGATVATTNLIQEAKRQETISRMLLIQTQVRRIMDQVSFDGDESRYIGRKLADDSDKEEIAGDSIPSEDLSSEFYYIYDQQTLDNNRLEGIKLEPGEVYIVDYRDGDVITPDGIESLSGSIVYRLSEVSN